MRTKKTLESDRSLRAKLRSPGRPPVLHQAERWPFWRALAQGYSSEEAAGIAGVSPVVDRSATDGSDNAAVCRHRILHHRRQNPQAATFRSQGVKRLRWRALVGEACGRLRDNWDERPRRNAATRRGGLEYRAHTAQWHADRAAKRPKPAKLVTNPMLRSYVKNRTLVERATRFAMLLHFPPQPGHRQQPRDKHGPALAGHGAEAVRDAITRAMASLPEQLRRSLTWDQGSEMSQHSVLSIDTGLKVYFCDPQSPWHRGTNELLLRHTSQKARTSAHTGQAS